RVDIDYDDGACTAAGQGDEESSIASSHTVVEMMRQGMNPKEACKAAIERIARMKRTKFKDIQVCFLAMNNKGEYGAFALQKGFSFAVKSNTEEKLHTSKSLY